MAGSMAQIGYWRVTADVEMIWSDEIYRIFGLPTGSKPPYYKDALQGYHPEDRNRIRKLLERALSTGEGFTYEMRFTRPDGSIRDVTNWCQSERGADGSIVGVFGVLQDITVSKDAEREQAKLAERVRMATEAGRVGVYEWSLINDSLIADKLAHELYGIDLSADGINADDWRSRVHPDDAKRMIDKFNTAAANGDQVLETEYRIVHLNGDVRHLRARGSLLSNAAGNLEKMVGVIWDVTELRVLAEQLHEEKERLQITLSSIGDAVVVTDELSRVTFMNSVAEKLIGWNLIEASNRPLSDFFYLVDDETNRPVESPVERCLATQAVVKLEDGCQSNQPRWQPLCNPGFGGAGSDTSRRNGWRRPCFSGCQQSARDAESFKLWRQSRCSHGPFQPR